jgi:hypothetical protein
MADAVYLETTLISYLVARDTTDVVRQGQQQITRQWWADRRSDFELFTSQLRVARRVAMKPDPIVEEVHQTREAIAKRFNNNLGAICADARKRQTTGGRKVVQRSPRSPRRSPVKSG